MSLEKLVQVGDDVWVDPATITGVQHWPETYDVALQHNTRDNTAISRTNGKYTISYWPFERIKYALGLVDKTWLHELWEADPIGTAELGETVTE